ncbi:Retrovirus-related Pol polyprotein, partial [Mucuna pruriens]
MVLARIQNSWQVCTDYRKLNQATRTDHLPLPFVDQVLEKLASISHFCLLDDSHSTRGSTQDYLHMSVRNVRIYKDVVWILQRSEYFPKMYDQHLLIPLGGLHEGIVLGHLVSARGIEINKAKINAFSSLPNLTHVQEVRFYKRFIKDFSKITLLQSKLLQKDFNFVFSQPCVDAFQELKIRLTSMPILKAPNWVLPFELMCDASNSVLGVVLGQRVGK